MSETTRFTRKYQLTKNYKVKYKEGYSRTLYQIQAIENFGQGYAKVNAGQLGGWVESEKNLSQLGCCWIDKNAEVFGDARVYDDAYVGGTAMVMGTARVYGTAMVMGSACIRGSAEVYESSIVSDNTKVTDKAHVKGNSIIADYAIIRGNARVYGTAKVYDYARVQGYSMVMERAKVYGAAKLDDNCRVSEGSQVYAQAKLRGSAYICGNTEVCGIAEVGGDAFIPHGDISLPNHVLVVGKIGSRDDFTTFYRGKDGSIHVKCGCFRNTLDKFLKKVDMVYGEEHEHGKVYRAAAELAKLVIQGETTQNDSLD